MVTSTLLQQSKEINWLPTILPGAVGNLVVVHILLLTRGTLVKVIHATSISPTSTPVQSSQLAASFAMLQVGSTCWQVSSAVAGA